MERALYRIRGARSHHVLDEILAHDHDAALTWGAAHLPGMGKILTGHGFELVGSYWRPAITKRKLTQAISASRAASHDHQRWPREGHTLLESVPVQDVRAMLIEPGGSPTRLPPERRVRC